MALYPDVQKKVRAEIEELLGRNRLPSMQDKVNLPYTEAVIHEISRLGSIVPLSLPHRCTSTFTLNGYTIPQNAMVFSNQYAVHHDPNNFQDPFVFKPERFLSDDGQKVTKADFLIPFGIGKTKNGSSMQTHSEKNFNFLSTYQNYISLSLLFVMKESFFISTIFRMNII